MERSASLQGVDYILREAYFIVRNPDYRLVVEPVSVFPRCLAADIPIPIIFTIPDAINVATQILLFALGRLGSKEVPAI